MRRRSTFKSFQKAAGTLDNVIAVIVYVIATGLVLRQLYRFVEGAFSR